jgi:hypothetical protein
MGLDARNWQIKTAAAPYLWSLNYVGTDFQTPNILTATVGGNVGINQTNPTSGKLEVQQSATTAALWVQTGGTTDSYTIADFRTGTNLSALAIKGDGDSIFNGNVGIGRTDPNARLDIKATGGSTGLTFETSDASNNQTFYILDGGRAGMQYYPFTIGMASSTSAASGARFQVATTGGDFVVLNDGKTGIGVSTVNNPFTAQAALQVGDTSTATNNGLITIGSGTTGSGDIYFADGTSGGSQYKGFVSYKHNGDYLAFGTAETTRMIIDSSGNVGIGQTNPQFGLSMAQGTGDGNRIGWNDGAGDKRASIICSSSTDALQFHTGTSDTERMRITSGGQIWMGRTNADISTQTGFRFDENGEAFASIDGAAGTNAWHVYDMNSNNYRFYVSGAGQIFATSTSITAISDITLKENIKPLETGLNEVMKLQPRRFDWKNGDGKNIAGFIAQEVEEVLPDLVDESKYTDEETKKSLKMGDMIPTLVKAIQELKAEIEELKAQINN